MFMKNHSGPRLRTALSVARTQWAWNAERGAAPRLGRVIGVAATVVLGAWGAAFAQAPPGAPAAPAPAVVSPAAVAAGIYAERRAAVEGACRHLVSCGCGDAQCTQDFGTGEALPLATFACVAAMPCAQLCVKDAGNAGTPVYDQCFDPKALAALEQTHKAKGIASYCGRLAACGCGEASCVEEHIKSTTNLDQDLFACLTPRPCEQLCGPQALAEGGPSHTACVVPALARKGQREALQLARSQSEHRMNMSIIRAMGNSGSKVRVYDSNGTYLRTE